MPGLALVVVLGLIVRLTHGWLPPAWGRAMGEAILGVLAGLAIGNLASPGDRFRPGIRFAANTLLRSAIVLLGARISFQVVLAIGGQALGIIVALMVIALVVTHTLGRAMGVSKKLATLLGVGTAVCGNSAISAAAPVIGATDEDVSLAIATNTLFGTIAVFLYPVLGQWMDMSPTFFGTWAGTAVNDTSQVVATGFSFGEEAGRVATTVKLTRNALMAVVIVGLSVAYKGEADDQSTGTWGFVRRSIPPFVLGFLVLSALTTAGVVDRLSGLVGRDLARDAGQVSKFFILLALTGVGLSTRVATFRRTGPAPFVLGLAAATTVSVTSLLLLRWLY